MNKPTTKHLELQSHYYYVLQRVLQRGILPHYLKSTVQL